MMRCIACAILLAACGGGSKPLPAWDKTLPPSSVMGSWRGLVPARGIIHLHSPYSWDACDGAPRSPAPLGAIDESCLDDLRAALCTDQIDFAALSDHDDTMSDEDFTTLFSMRGNDTAVTDATGRQIASHMTCDDGHVVTITVGTENDLMPIMLHDHVPGTVSDRQAIYTGSDAASAMAMRQAGALVWIAHTEEHTIDQLRDVLPDGIEVYNLHANIDPKIRSMYLNEDADAALDAAVQFADTNPNHPEPDLALLGFLEVNQPAVTTWNQILADGRHIPATAGTDAHQNVLPTIFADGERGDSYRRLMRWFSNVVLVQDPTDPTQIQAALAAGQVFAVFELMGTPDGFDIHATTAAGATVELGGTVNVSDQATLVVDVPRVLNLSRSLPAPEINATVLHVDSTGVTTVATGAGPELDVPLAAPGAYRVEITMVPHHLGPYLGDLGTTYAEQSLPWIYASPIYVQ
ncbi:MAG TPA: hypothetical protein VLX92_28240 [Kofleriaceae bacterium]|nr:hypothetical protein [Kofleriaceae bacterium]